MSVNLPKFSACMCFDYENAQLNNEEKHIYQFQHTEVFYHHLHSVEFRDDNIIIRFKNRPYNALPIAFYYSMKTVLFLNWLQNHKRVHSYCQK